MESVSVIDPSWHLALPLSLHLSSSLSFPGWVVLRGAAAWWSGGETTEPAPHCGPTTMKNLLMHGTETPSKNHIDYDIVKPPTD